MNVSCLLLTIMCLISELIFPASAVFIVCLLLVILSFYLSVCACFKMSVLNQSLSFKEDLVFSKLVIGN